MALIRTKSEYDYSTYDDRALTHKGDIIDVGVLGWDMFASIQGTKLIYGIDPWEETKPDGCILFNGLLGAYDGDGYINKDGDASTLHTEKIREVHKFPMMTFNSFCKSYGIQSVSILKLNIEGAEYPLLNSMDTDDFDKIDQIMVSFHDWINPKWRHLTFAAIQLLMANGYHRAHIASQYGWNLFVKQ